MCDWFMSSKTDEKAEKEECLKEDNNGKEEDDDWDTWTDPLEELSEIEDAFKASETDKLHGKTILDVGTDCVKPLYIALKFEPYNIVGINEESYSFASDIEQQSKLFTKTCIHFYDCSLFDDENLKRIMGDEKIEKFDFVLVSKTLHHLRGGTCIASERGSEHKCREDEKCCIYKFEAQDIFDRLLRLGKRVIIYEYFDSTNKDDDKVRGRGGYFTTKEWKQIFRHLSANHKVEFFRPNRWCLEKKGLTKVNAKLRQVDYVCFSVEAKISGRDSQRSLKHINCPRCVKIITHSP